ncbi:MAG: nitronate monooxygenase [Synergistaceae bacterium]|nr:nitronate monooxygenase [Synergistaceae bacterium]
MERQNRIKALLKIKYPLLLGGMAWIADAQLAAAVSNGGGIGIIAAANMPPDLLEKELIKIRNLTDKPFGLNIMLMSSTADAAMDLAVKHKVPVVTTGAGTHGKVLSKLKPLGIIVIPVIASVAQAKRYAKQGADAVIAEGMEAGGHIGELTTMVLVPQIVDSVEIPVIAAGGIADSRGTRAAFALGAEGIQVGTRFLCSNECNVHVNYKKAILDARDRDTTITGQRTGHPVRCIRNKLTAKFESLDKNLAGMDEIEKLGAGRLKDAVINGDVEWGSVMAGQSSAMVNDIKPAAQIIEDLFKGVDVE